MKNFFLLFLLIYAIIDVQNSYSQDSSLLCGMREDSLPTSVRETLKKLPNLMRARTKKISATEMRVCRLAIDIDSYTWQQSGYDSLELIKTLHETVSTCSKQFEDQISVRLVISYVTIFKDPSTDPYRNATGAYSYYLSLLNLPPPQVEFDKRIVLFTRPTSDYSGWAPYGGRLSSAMLDSPPIIMHELGHSFGSPHTHSCEWPGGPIDFCSPLEGGPCYDGSMEVRSRPASLMSYCDLVVNIHPLCQAVMEEHAKMNFQSIKSTPTTVVLPNQAIISPSLYVPWAASYHALSYEVMYATLENFQEAQIIETHVNGIALGKIKAGNRFYIRIRSKNTLGVSAWSNTRLIDISNLMLQAPILRKPDHQSIVTGQQRLEFEPVIGATAYEIHLTTANDVKFNGFIKEITQNTFFDFDSFFDTFRWRVRALFGGIPGPWSQVRLFSCNASLKNGLTLPFDPVTDMALLSFPFRYSPPRFNTIVRVTVSTKIDMSDPLFDKTYQQTSNQFSDLVNGLPANQQLYFRVREVNLGNERLPEGTLVNFIQSFRTGALRLDPRIEFMVSHSPEIFAKNPITLALSDNHLWFRSYNTGYIQLSLNDLKYQIHNRENTKGLIGVSRADASVYGDKEGNISFLNDGINGSIRIIRLNGETVNSTATVQEFVTLRSFYAFNSDNDICWNNKKISQLRHNELDKTLFEAERNGFIFDVKVNGDLIYILYINNDQQRNEIVTIRSDGTIMQRYYSQQNSYLKDQFRQFDVDLSGEIWIRQEATNGTTSIVSIKGENFRMFQEKDILGAGQHITSLFVSRANRVYIIATGNSSQVYRLEKSGEWKEIGPVLPFQIFGDQLWVDRLENFWISSQYGLVLVKSGDPVLSIEPEPEYVLKLYPNPSSDKLRLEYSKALWKPSHFYITDIKGRTIASYFVTEKQSEIDIRTLPFGVYIIWTEMNNKKVTGRFFKY